MGDLTLCLYICTLSHVSELSRICLLFLCLKRTAMKLFTAGSAKVAYPSAVQLTHDAIERVLSLTQLREKKNDAGPVL